MPTMTDDSTTTTTPLEDPTLAQIEFGYRWLTEMQQQHTDIPEPVLRCFFEHEAAPSVADLQAALACDETHAASWVRVLALRLVSPGHYTDIFVAEDAVNDLQQQWRLYEEDVRATAAELAAVHQAIELKRAESYLPAYESEAKQELTRLDAEDDRLRRKQARLPGTGTLLEHQVTEAKAALEAAEAVLKAAQVEHLQAVEDAWLQEVLALLEPVQTLLGQGGWLDQSWARLGVTPGREHGKARLQEVALARLRR
jgi:hypothetical protein